MARTWRICRAPGCHADVPGSIHADLTWVLQRNMFIPSQCDYGLRQFRSGPRAARSSQLYGDMTYQTRCWPSVGIMLGHCLRRWPSSYHWGNVSCMLECCSSSIFTLLFSMSWYSGDRRHKVMWYNGQPLSVTVYQSEGLVWWRKKLIFVK